MISFVILLSKRRRDLFEQLRAFVHIIVIMGNVYDTLIQLTIILIYIK